MKILMLVNWKIKYGDSELETEQKSDYYVKGKSYWFYRYFKEKPEVDVIDIRSFGIWEKFEKNILRFYIWQAVRGIFRLKKYDLVVSHGMQSAVVVSLWRRFFRTKAKHIVFEIGGFNSAAESGIALRMMQFASKSIDCFIYHTSNQIEYYKKCFPWIVEKSHFIRFGTDLEFFEPSKLQDSEDKNSYIICVGYSKRDWDTLIKAYGRLETKVKLRLIGHVDEKYKGIPGVEQLPYMPVKELMNQIYNAMFCVLPLESLNYSYGQMTLMQQMALKKCVVVARVPSLKDYVEDDKTAILYNAGDAEDLKSKMERILMDSEIRNRIGEDGRAYLLGFCNEKIFGETLEPVFKSLM